MKIHKVNNNIIDVFLDFNTPTGYDPSCWLRLHRSKQNGQWKQVSGIKLPSYKYQNLLKELSTK